MNNYFGTRVVFTPSAFIQEITTVKRTLRERLKSKFFQTTKNITTIKPGMYKLDGIVYVHPDLAEEIYRIMNKEDDAPTLKVKAVK